MKHNHNAFTLIEVLMATAIAFMMITICAFAQINMNETTERSTAVASLNLQSSALIKKLREDFAGIQSHCALNVHLSGTSDPAYLAHLTFMRGIPWEIDAEGIGASGNTYRVKSRQALQWFHELVWVRWQFDEQHGLRRAISPKIESLVTGTSYGGKGDSAYFFNGDANGLGIVNPANLNGKTVIPQREYKYFDNQGDFSDASNQVNNAQCSAWIHEWKASAADISYFGMTPGFWFDTDPYKDPLFMWNNAQGKHYFLGNNGPIANAYAAALSFPNRPDEHLDGFPVLYNRNKLDLLGVPGEENNQYYPSRLSPVSSNVDLFTVEIVQADDSLIQRGSASITEAIDGVRLTPDYYRPGSNSGLRSTSDGERSYTLGKRPKLLRVKFIIHNMPVDPSRPFKEDPSSTDFPGEDFASIHYLRHVFYDTLPSGDQTHSTLKRMIEAGGYTALTVVQSIKVN